MIGGDPIATVPIAGGVSVPIPITSQAFFDPSVTVLSQYANSPTLLALISDFSQWLDPASRFDAFYSYLWDIDTAVGFGLDVWGRILGVSRVLQVPTGDYLGFVSNSAAKPFGFGIWYSDTRATLNVALTDSAYRVLLLSKAALNITDASVPAINQILLTLFGGGYVRDNLNMTITYVFPFALTPVQTAIIFQSNVLPKPCGVSFDVEQP